MFRRLALGPDFTARPAGFTPVICVSETILLWPSVHMSHTPTYFNVIWGHHS